MSFLAILGRFDSKKGITGQPEFSRKQPMVHSNFYLEEHLCKISEKSLEGLLRKRVTYGGTDEGDFIGPTLRCRGTNETDSPRLA